MSVQVNFFATYWRLGQLGTNGVSTIFWSNPHAVFNGSGQAKPEQHKNADA